MAVAGEGNELARKSNIYQRAQQSFTLQLPSPTLPSGIQPSFSTPNCCRVSTQLTAEGGGGRNWIWGEEEIACTMPGDRGLNGQLKTGSGISPPISLVK